MIEIVWTDYLLYRAKLRGYDLSVLETVLRHSSERYSDLETGRLVVVGRHNDKLVMIPYESDGNAITPVTVHVVTKQQIKFRLRMGRLVPYE